LSRSERQRLEDCRIDAHAVAPAGSVSGSRVGQGAVIARAAGRAEVGFVSESGISRVRHFHAGAVTAGLLGPLHRMIGPRQQGMQGVMSMYGGGTDVFPDITANCGASLLAAVGQPT
jgi:hypothetical protein